MSEKTEIFYNLFWQSKSCQNLFLLSKNELLDTKSIQFEGNKTNIFFPRIILSNVENDEHSRQKVSLRAENHQITAGNNLQRHIETYMPLFENFFQDKFGKSLKKLAGEVEKNPFKFSMKIIKLFIGNEQKIEGNIVNFLQNYGLIGKQINSFEALQNYLKKEALDKNFKTFVTETNVFNVLEFIRTLKDIYLNELYKGMYESNQLQVNALYDFDNFESRIKLFDLLFESGIIAPSQEESFLECFECDSGQYKGIMHLKIRPSKTTKLICPICASKLKYYIPYELDNDIFELIKKKDGLLLDSLCDLLRKNEIVYNINVMHKNDIEIDCIYQTKNDNVYIVESKMYKLNTTPDKLRSKLKKHFGELIKDITNLKEEDREFKKTIFPLLLVNVYDSNFLKEVELELKSSNDNILIQQAKIINTSQIPLQ